MKHVENDCISRQIDKKNMNIFYYIRCKKNKEKPQNFILNRSQWLLRYFDFAQNIVACFESCDNLIKPK